MSKQLKLIFLLVLLLFGLFFVFQRPQPVLRVCNWSEYIDPAIVKQFEKEQHCKVVIDSFDSNEAMYAHLKIVTMPYDVVIPTSYMAKVLHNQGMLQEIDHRQVPNLSHIDPEYLERAVDKSMSYSVPYMLSNTGIGYVQESTGPLNPSWSVFDRQDLKGRMTMLNDMRETIGAALKFLGYSLNTRNENELAQARDVLLRWKKNLARFNNLSYKKGLTVGKLALAQGYSGDILQAGDRNKSVAFLAPEEGIAISCDDLVIPNNSAHPDLAHNFINFLHDPKIAAQNTTFLRYLAPNKDAYALLSAEIKGNRAVFLDPAVRAKSEVIEDLGADNAKYVKIWQQVRAGN
jgi:spermidine/putrescine transport system substrate-binding protein